MTPEAEQAFDAVRKALRERGWLAADGIERQDGSFSFTALFPAVDPNDGRSLLIPVAVSVPRADLPFDWLDAARDAALSFDPDAHSVGVISPDLSEVGNLPSYVASALARKASVDANRSTAFDGRGPAPKKRLVFSDDVYAPTESTRAKVASAMRLDPREVSDSLLFETLSRLRSDEFSDECANVARACHGHTLVADGTLGLWDGSVPACIAASDFATVYSKVMGADCDVFRAWDENGRLFVEGAHRDGVNRFEVRHLNDEGEAALGRIIESGEGVSQLDLKILFDDAYSELPRVAERSYGMPRAEYEAAAPASPDDFARAARASVARGGESSEGRPDRPIAR